MSTWRKKALEILPALKKDFNREDLTIYDVLIELVQATVQAHRQNEKEALKSYYGFAQWCYQQKSKILWNAAGVAFYEHLVDYEETFNAIHLWVDPSTFNEIKGLLAAQLPDKKFQELEGRYR